MDNAPVRIDLHMHSTASDGTNTPSELLCRVKEAGLTVFSLTDHDAIRGCEAIRAILSPNDPRFLFGVEFSCKDPLGKYHILGYGYDPDSPSIRAVVDLGHRYRMEKLDERLVFLDRKFGFVFSEEEQAMLHALPNPGKPHLANLMVRHGYAPDAKTAFTNWLSQCVSEDLYPRPEEAIEGVLGAGGIPVLAHPCYGDGDQLILGDALDARVRRLMDFGLKGLECYYSGFTEKLRAQVLSLADRYDLYSTAGSDYHGANKLIRLADTGLSANAPLPPRLSRFLEALNP